MVYLVITILFLHVTIIPCLFSVDINIANNNKTLSIAIAAAFIPFFKLNIDLNPLIEREEDENGSNSKKTADYGKRVKNNAFIKAIKRIALRIGIKIVKRVRVRHMGLSAEIGTGDAAASALAVGGIKVIYSTVCDFLCYDYNGDSICARYDIDCASIDFSGIFLITLADIIIAVISAVLNALTVAKEKICHRLYVKKMLKNIRLKI